MKSRLVWREGDDCQNLFDTFSHICEELETFAEQETFKYSKQVLLR